MTTNISSIQFRAASIQDVDALIVCVRSAYEYYEKRLGRMPGPMLLDYHQVMNECDVFVASTDQGIVGVLVLQETIEGVLLDNIAVHPNAQGKGVGRKLLMFAEERAKQSGYDSVYLYTNEKMVENIKLYEQKGYREFDRRIENGLSRVYMRKHLLN